MGEVYRADDLKLGQPVALKFLPPALAQDSVRRERFFAEVRITRQLSHPNICRVYDIGEVDGRHFLSMEYIDGEDLASLMKRIGHLSNEKALDIARQLVAGLSVAHERGVLHRDLKPANIMLDGHGRVRITDFGLAIAVGDESQAEEIAGTPAYMAPEQLAGKGATVRSDIYSLGLILYEIYTGKKAFTARTLAELREQKETQTSRAPSEIREGIDPVVERLIQRCMEKDPNARPASVAQLVQALPGGDPLAAAIAAGETPSPEMVAASGSTEGFKPWIAWGLLFLIIVGTFSILVMSGKRSSMHRLIPFENSPLVLAERSRRFLERTGYLDKSANRAYGYVLNQELTRYIQETDKSADRWKNPGPKAFLFWYRQSPKSLNPGAIFGETSPEIPPLQNPGEILIQLDTEGRLVSFRAVPLREEPTAEEASHPDPDWKLLFSEAGLDDSQWKSTDPKRRPPYYADSRFAWERLIPDQPKDPIRIESAALQGNVVSFEILYPWNREAQPSFAWTKGIIIAVVGISIFGVFVLVGGILLARRNLRLGRGDRRNATRVALAILTIWILAHIFQIPRISFLNWLLLPPYAAFLTWIFYVALEPFVRRRWPHVLISWNRLLSGEWKDPLVGRHVLAGCAFGVVAHCINLFFLDFMPSWFKFLEPVQPIVIAFKSLLGTRFFIAAWLDAIVIFVFLSLALLCLLVIARILLRNQKLAIAASLLIMSSFAAAGGIWSFSVQITIWALCVFALMRFGLVACFFLNLLSILTVIPISLSPAPWYSPYGYATLAIFFSIVLYAFYTSLGGRPLFGTPRLDD
jgi:tRNA A-37 threonylcarbamoyl transferase component Bud32